MIRTPGTLCVLFKRHLLTKTSSHLCVVKRYSAHQPLSTVDIKKLDEVKSHLISTLPRELMAQAVIAPCLKPNLDLRTQLLPQDASAPEKLTAGKLAKYYSLLAKYRLTGLVVWSAVAGYAMAPLATDWSTMAVCLVGTALTSASANTINQFFEVPFDSQMARTNNRVLVRGLLRYIQ